MGCWLHYIGKVHDPRTPLRLIFDEITEGQLKWHKMDQEYDKIVIGNNEFSLIEGLSNFKAKMFEYFPEEKEAINKYIDLIKKVNSASKSYFVKNLTKVVEVLSFSFHGESLFKYTKKTTNDVLKKLTKNKMLMAVLTGQWGDYGLPQDNLLFYSCYDC